ncbi:MAG: hypothetical protein WBB34_00905 [Xanthobacteraceae bacterium]
MQSFKNNMLASAHSMFRKIPPYYGSNLVLDFFDVMRGHPVRSAKNIARGAFSRRIKNSHIQLMIRKSKKYDYLRLGELPFDPSQSRTILYLFGKRLDLPAHHEQIRPIRWKTERK